MATKTPPEDCFSRHRLSAVSCPCGWQAAVPTTRSSASLSSCTKRTRTEPSRWFPKTSTCVSRLGRWGSQRRIISTIRSSKIRVFEDLIVEIILRCEPQRPSLDTHVDVFGNQRDGSVRVRFVQELNDADDLVVGTAACQPHGQDTADSLCLEKQSSGGVFVAMRLERDSLVDIAYCAAD